MNAPQNDVESPEEVSATKNNTLKYRAPAAVAALALPLFGHVVLERFGIPHGQAEMIAAGGLALSPALLAKEIGRSASNVATNARNRLSAILKIK